METISALTFITGVFSIGIGGFLLMVGVAYATVTENLALLLVCGLLLFSPFIFGIIWCIGACSSLLAERTEQESGKVAGVYSK